MRSHRLGPLGQEVEDPSPVPSVPATTVVAKFDWSRVGGQRNDEVWNVYESSAFAV